MLAGEGPRRGEHYVSVRFDDLIRRWERALARQELSAKTIRTYDWGLQDFRRFLAGHGVTINEQLQREVIEDWQDGCRSRLSRRSRSTASVAVRQFLRWSVGQGAVDPRAPYWVTRVKGVRGKPRPIPSETLHLVLGYLSQRRFAGSLVDLRDRALFLYILSTGARVSEALQVKRSTFRRALVVEKGGGDKVLESVPIVVEALEDYLAERRDANPWMWITLDTNHPTRPLAPGAVREIWRRLAGRLQIPHWTTHQLRHTGATELYAAGIDGMVIADWLGHQGMGHVTQYAGISWRRRQEALAVFQQLIQRASTTASGIRYLRRRAEG